METKKARIVCYINQFFAQIGGEDKANVGVSVKNEPVGPTLLFDKMLKDIGDVVGTVICGDNYFVENQDQAIDDAMKIIEELKPDIFFVGPSFTAGRYGMNCGAIAMAVSKKLGIPCIAGMNEEAPAVPIYQQSMFILKTAQSARRLKDAVKSMVGVGRKILTGERVGSAALEGYFIRNRLINELVEKTASQRAIEMLKNKLTGDEWVSEIEAPKYKKIEPPKPLADIKSAKIAIVSDGGYIPTDNPDQIKSAAASTFGRYDLDHLVKEDGMVIHAGYDKVYVDEDPNRLLPRDAMKELEEHGEIGSLAPYTYMTTGNVMAVKIAENIGDEIVKGLLTDKVDAAILTST